MTTGYQSVALGYFYDDRDPTASETDVDTIVSAINEAGVPQSIQSYLWWNQSTKTFFRLLSAVSGELVWEKTIVESDLNNLNIGNLNQPRNYQTITLEVNTPRTPNPSRDVYLSVTADTTSTLLTAAYLNLEFLTATDPDIWSTKVTRGQSGVEATHKVGIDLPIPANTTYRLTPTGDVSNISVLELQN